MLRAKVGDRRVACICPDCESDIYEVCYISRKIKIRYQIEWSKESHSCISELGSRIKVIDNAIGSIADQLGRIYLRLERMKDGLEDV